MTRTCPACKSKFEYMFRLADHLEKKHKGQFVISIHVKENANVIPKSDVICCPTCSKYGHGDDCKTCGGSGSILETTQQIHSNIIGDKI
jgi:hypothetical protein